jgi:P4 family phage/plasmid primase-like protien
MKVKVIRLNRKTIRRLTTLGNAITIPQSLIDKLKPFGARYIKVAKAVAGDNTSGKKAFEFGFQNNPYQADDSSLQAWVSIGGNYGILAGKCIILIDADCKEAQQPIAKYPTLTVQSGRINGEGRHYYFTSDVTENGQLIDSNGKNIGQIQAYNKYVVGPNSRHFSGGTYCITNDIELAYISKQQLEEAYGSILKWSGQTRKENIEEANEERRKINFDLPLANLIDLSELEQRGDEYQGEHPIHGSTNGMNFCVNPKQGDWHCFRCDSGGGGLMWIAVKHGLLQCREAKKGALRGQLFKEAVRLAIKDGYPIPIEFEEEALSSEVARFFDKNKRFIPAYVAKELMEATGFFTESSRSLLYRYDDKKGIYKPDGQSYIDKWLTEKLGKEYNIKRRNEVQAYIQGSSIREQPETDKYLIAVRNGVLDIRTKELKPFSRDYYIFNALPVAYDPNAKCPRYLQFLSEVVPSEADRLLLQEHGGYNLLKDCRFQKALMLIGNTQNGKGTLLNAWMAMLGKDNITALPLQILSDSRMRFYTSQLHGKIANVCTDLPSEALKETDSFKKIVSGDRITGELKFSPPFDFNPYAKLLYSANQLPALPKDTDAFLVRWNMVAFPNQFLPGDPRRDENLFDKLTTPEELSGIFNWCLEGLDRLLKQKGFSRGETLEQAKDRWIVEGDSVKAFKERCIEEDLSGGGETLEDVWQAYIEFCKKHKVNRPKNKITFGSAFREYYSTTRTHRDSKEARVWQFIALKPEEQME